MPERRIIRVEGIVQGVGFRPFVARLARARGLRGTVRNDAAGVRIDVEGQAETLDSFVSALAAEAPPLASIEGISVRRAGVLGRGGFHIEASHQGGDAGALIGPDVAPCADCLAELRDPGDRRYGYPFVNCTNCGPRFTIVRGVPYDRSRTTMAAFPLCPECSREYADPRDRRFHAQPLACPACGPQVSFRECGPGGPPLPGRRALAEASAALRQGRIVAVKGLGGFHLACDARDDDAVRWLRARKGREARPLAVMVPDLVAAGRLALLDELESRLLESPERPIVLAAKRPRSGLAESVAPGIRWVGLMLPYTPLHHLLLEETGGPLVMTSGNLHDEPIAYQDDDARSRLAGVADAFLEHDRPIQNRCDDSVVRVAAGGPSFLRRSRGFAPRPLTLRHLSFSAPTLAVGGHLKNAFCLARGRRAFLSHHVGDLETPAAVAALGVAVESYSRLFDCVPEIVAHDLHPDYASTAYALGLDDVAHVAVQHHHAHVAACMAEHACTEPVIGVAFDGAGLGTDGAVWGGEILVVGVGGYQRAAHLAYVPLPGGDAAAREPWRMALAHLRAASGRDPALEEPLLAGIDASGRALMDRLLGGGFDVPQTSSAGRLFDAIAALTGVRRFASFEGQAAMELESLAEPDGGPGYPVEVRDDGDTLLMDPGPIVRGVVHDVRRARPAAGISWAFHEALADLVVATAVRIRRRTGISDVALTGGVFQNALLTRLAADGLADAGFRVLVHRRVPPNDGGLALGQAVVAGASLRGPVDEAGLPWSRPAGFPEGVPGREAALTARGSG